MNDKKQATKVSQKDNYKKYLFLVPILEKRTLTHTELGDLLEEKGFNRDSLYCVVATLSNHVPLYNPTEACYRILTREQLDLAEQRALELRRIKKQFHKAGKK